MHERRPPAAGPWAYFVPVALASFVGALAAGLVWRSLGPSMPSGGAAPAEPIQAAPLAAQDPAGRGTATAPDESTVAAPTPASAGVQRPGPAQRVEDVAPLPPPSLPGALLARRDGAPEACINGTVAWRDENGWQQRLVDDAPVACVETSASPR